MKKNFMMRAASVLLVAVMLTTCAISGTFAKYVSANDANDSARVAKWGVVVTVTGDAFSTTYDRVEDGNDADEDNVDITVNSDVNVVAPGTTGTFGGVALLGTPEVAVNVSFDESTVDLTGWTLAGDVFYCPIVFDMNGTEVNGLDYTSADELESDLLALIKAGEGDYDVNTDLSTIQELNGSYTWTWAFVDGTGAAQDQTDAKDTELGNQAARGVLNKIAINVKCTVTQID